MTSWTDYQDDISDAISESMDVDWSASVGARAVVAWLNEHRPVSAAPAPEGGAVPDDVRRLVIAARNVAFDTPTQSELRALDIASEAFASRVPWEDEPEAIATREEAPAEAGELIDHLEAYRPHLADDGVSSLYVSMTLPQLDAALSAIRAQPQARDALRVAVEALERADRVIGWMSDYVGKMSPPADGLLELNQHWLFMQRDLATLQAEQKGGA